MIANRSAMCVSSPWSPTSPLAAWERHQWMVGRFGVDGQFFPGSADTRRRRAVLAASGAAGVAGVITYWSPPVRLLGV
ncbi:twin-arginine translocation signal domain-containing protein [Mycolicibacterium conceptionense]|uniref:twin-arginine translocation signal domain-containing protein n=1 Tax=Mycolicibacterium conceptionense TaxID=451644 RepID=UPI003D161692